VTTFIWGLLITTIGQKNSMLDKFSIPYAVHIESGDRAKMIIDAVRRLHCDEIVMATARKNSLTRLVESSATNRVLQLTPVPVEVIAGD
jgi:nucleotide-binding universal stress UspA family protein